MRVLAFDTAADGCALALLDQDGHVLAEKIETMGRGQDARLIPMLEEMMASAGIAFGDLDRLAVTTGPGSFTGLRVGLAAAHGLQLATGLPCIGIDCFTLYADATLAAKADPGKLLIVLESKREELYARQDARAPWMASAAALADDAAAQNAPIAGDASHHLLALRPDLRALAAPANRAVIAGRLALKQPLPPAHEFPKPFYLRPPDVTRPKSAR